jgi:dTDP-4-amino-4,6-dideoxygalactose transaminase
MDKRVAFLDLRISDQVDRKELLDAIDAVFQHGIFIIGPEVQQFEEKIACSVGRRYAIGVNSGTDALFIALKSMGVGKGDEVITTSLSWIATANAIALTGATPVFADIRDDLNIDPESVKRSITSKTKVIMPVHYTGKVCQMDSLMRIADAHGLIVIEDAAQAFNAIYKGKKAGSFGSIGCFSMNPMKVLGAAGETGAIVTDQNDLYEKLIALRYNGTINKEVCIEPSLNGRIDTIQAAILLKKLDKVEAIIKKRRSNAKYYDERLRDIVDIPFETEDEIDVYYTYTIKTEDRDKLKSYLEEKGIETKIQHPYLMPEQPAYNIGVKGKYENAKKLVKTILCLPINEKLNEKELDYVVENVRSFFEG